MAREDQHFRLRIPEGLKAKVEAAAKENHRSMTAEIVSRLETTFEMDAYQPGENIHADPKGPALSVPAMSPEATEKVLKAIEELREQVEVQGNYLSRLSGQK